MASELALSTGKLPSVFISLLNWNSYAETIRCIEMIQQGQDYPHYQIIVVDNASQDHSVDHIRAAFPDVTVIAAGTNNGYATGHNLAVDAALQANADLIWLLNTDITFANEQVLTSLVSAYLQKGSALYGSVLLHPDDDTLLQRDFDDLDKGGLLTSIDWHSELAQGRTLKHVKAASGASFLIPLTVIKTHGFMDESFFLYAEETDYCLRLASQGIHTYLVLTSQVRHRGTFAGRNRKLDNAIRYYYERNILILAKRYDGQFKYWRKIASQRNMVLCLKVLIKRILGMNQTLAYHQQYLQCLALRDAILGRMGKTLSPEDFLN